MARLARQDGFVRPPGLTEQWLQGQAEGPTLPLVRLHSLSPVVDRPAREDPVLEPLLRAARMPQARKISAASSA